jgi:hypothetical protein
MSKTCFIAIFRGYFTEDQHLLFNSICDLGEDHHVAGAFVVTGGKTLDDYVENVMEDGNKYRTLM